MIQCALISTLTRRDKRAGSDWPGQAIGGQAAKEGRGAADRGEYRQAAGAVEII
jgi:hypothetical protein